MTLLVLGLFKGLRNDAHNDRSALHGFRSYPRQSALSNLNLVAWAPLKRIAEMLQQHQCTRPDMTIDVKLMVALKRFDGF